MRYLLFPILLTLLMYVMGVRKSTHIADNDAPNRHYSSLLNEVKHIKESNNLSQYNNQYIFLIDMSVQSYNYRFFVFNLLTSKVIDSGLVAHGIGSKTGTPCRLRFSNEPNSYCSSTGLYKIGKAYKGRFGKSYTLYGLSPTNTNAYARHIVLHAYYDVPYKPIKVPICNSLGCPMVNKVFYNRLEKLIDNSKNPILLSIFY